MHCFKCTLIHGVVHGEGPFLRKWSQVWWCCGAAAHGLPISCLMIMGRQGQRRRARCCPGCFECLNVLPAGRASPIAPKGTGPKQAKDASFAIWEEHKGKQQPFISWDLLPLEPDPLTWLRKAWLSSHWAGKAARRREKEFLFQTRALLCVLNIASTANLCNPKSSNQQAAKESLCWRYQTKQKEPPCFWSLSRCLHGWQ